MWLLLAALSGRPAHAHYPHAVVEWVAPSPAGQLAAQIARVSTQMVSLSADQAHWQVHYLGPGRVEFPDGAWLSETRLVAGTSVAGLWESGDGGLSWTEVPDLPEDAAVSHVVRSPTVLEDGTAFATAQYTTDEGERVASIWRTRDQGDSWQEVLVQTGIEEGAGSWLAIDVSPLWATDGRVCALGDRGGLACSSDGGDTWTVRMLGEDLGPGHDIALGPQGRVYVATAWGLYLGEADVELRDGEDGEDEDGAEDGWTAVAPEGLGAAQIVVALEDGRVIVGDSHDLWRSSDGGRSWSEASAGLSPRTDKVGGPADGLHLLEAKRGADGAVYLATWEGVYRSTGAAWEALHPLPATLARGIDVSPRSTGGAWVLLGTEGGGAILTDSDGSFAWPMGALGDEADALPLHARDAALSPSFETDGLAAVGAAWGVVLTTSWGQSWRRTGDASSPEVLAMGPQVEGLPTLIAGGDGDDARLQVLADRDGELQVALANPPCEDGNGVPGQISPWLAQDPTLVAACSPMGAIYSSTDGGSTWTGVAQIPGESIFTLARLPDGATWVATSLGLYAVPAGSDTAEVLAFEDEQVHFLAVSPGFADDGTAFVVLARGAWYRTVDGGQSWQALAAPSTQVPWQVVVAADFPESGIVVVGSMDGAWASDDRGESWRWIWRLDRLEEFESSSQVRFHPDEDWVVEVQPGASGGRIRRAASAGSEVVIDFEGDAIDLLMGTAPDGGAVSVSLDGGAAQTVLLEGDLAYAVTAWSADGLDDGWHQLRVVALAPGVAFDAAYGWHGRVPTSGAMPWEAADDTGQPDTGPVADSGEPADGGSPGDGGSPTEPGGCGCAAGIPAGGPAGLSLLLLLGWRRRRQGLSPG